VTSWFHYYGDGRKNNKNLRQERQIRQTLPNVTIFPTLKTESEDFSALHGNDRIGGTTQVNPFACLVRFFSPVSLHFEPMLFRWKTTDGTVSCRFSIREKYNPGTLRSGVADA